MKKIAILGGTFNPIHNGHLKLVDNALSQFDLDELWLMPAPNPPHKSGRVITDYAHRIEMVRLAIADDARLTASDFETHRTGKSYTSDTLTELTDLFPDCRFYFLMGADSFYEFDTWHEPGIILSHAALIVASRNYAKDHSSLDEQAAFLRGKYPQAEIGFIHAPEVDISSEEIRSLYEEGKGDKAAELIPATVAAYIAAHGLYVKDTK